MEKVMNQKEIENWLIEKEISNFTIHDNLTVSVKGDVDLSQKKLTHLPFKFNEIKGNFFASGNLLSNFDNFPNLIEKDLVLCDNKFTTLKGLENITFLKALDVSYNQITHLSHLPNEINGSFSCANNQLKTLVGSPDIIKDSFFCSHNELKTLIGGPSYVNDMYVCKNNEITTLEGAPLRVYSMNCSDNKITSFKGGPQMIDSSLNINNNPLKSCEYIPSFKGILDLKNTHIKNLNSLTIKNEAEAVVISNTKIYSILDLNIENINTVIYHKAKKEDLLQGLSEYYVEEEENIFKLNIHTKNLLLEYKAFKEKKNLENRLMKLPKNNKKGLKI